MIRASTIFNAYEFHDTTIDRTIDRNRRLGVIYLLFPYLRTLSSMFSSFLWDSRKP